MTSILILLTLLTGTVAVIQWIRRIDARQWGAWRATCYGIRADYEHQALCRGDMRTGLYGQYQPPEELRRL